MQRVSDDDFSADGFAYLDAKQRHGRRRARRSPCGSASSASSATSSTSRARSPSTSGTRSSTQAADLDPKPFGLEPQRILRLEKGHVIVGQDTDSESNLHEAAMPWLVKNDKEFDWVGKWATQQVADRGLALDARRLREPLRRDPGRGRPGRRSTASPSGRVTSVRRSAELGKVIGLAIVPNDLAVDGGRFDVQVERPRRADDGAPRALLRPGRREGEVVSALAFLSVDAAADHGDIHPVAESAIERAQRDLGAHLRGARRLARPRLDPGRGGAPRPSGSPTSRI